MNKLFAALAAAAFVVAPAVGRLNPKWGVTRKSGAGKDEWRVETGSVYRA